MIDGALKLLKDEVEAYIHLKDPAANVIVDNIGMTETSVGDKLPDHIVLSLVNIEEESTLKNKSALKRPFGNSAIYENNPVYLNLYVLFTCNYAGTGYLFALKRLGYIIQFVQSKSLFSSGSTVTGTPTSITDELKFTLELYTLTFEQINHLWGSLGGRQVPFVMYKLRLIAITENALVREVPLIEEIETTLMVKNSN